MKDNLKKAIEQMKRGEEKGFNTIYSETYNRVYFRAKQIMKTEEDAQDLTQIVFAEAFKNIHTLQAEEALYKWLDGITYNQGMKIYRKQKDVLLTEEAEGMFEELESNDTSSMPELTADQKATADIIKGIIEELPELQRTAVVAYYFDGLKVEQIAEMMECSVNTVKSRLSYARKYMKTRVEEKEKKEGYRLHVLGLPVLWYALKALAEESTLTAYAAEKVYSGACSSVGLQATTITASAAGATSAGVTASVGTTAGATAVTTGTGTAAAGTTGATADAATAAIGTTAVTAGTGAATGGTMNIIIKNLVVAGLGFTLSFAGAYGFSQMQGRALEITTVQEAQAILDGQTVGETEAESGGNTDANVGAEAEPVQDEGQGATQDTPQDETQDATQDVAEEAKEGEVQFNWSFDDWTYNGLHISEGVDAMARSVGLDPTLENDNTEHPQFGNMWYGKLEKEIVLQEGKGRITYREFIYENGGNNSLDIHMNTGILDAGGNPVDVSDITGVPFSAGTLEEAETVFGIKEIMEKGTQTDKKTVEGREDERYTFSSNLGDGTLVSMRTETDVTYQIQINKDGAAYIFRIDKWSDSDMYTATYSYRLH